MKYDATLAKKLRELREAKELTLRQVVRDTGLQNYPKYESGQTYPQRGTVLLLQKYYGVKNLTYIPEARAPDEGQVVRLANKRIGLEIAKEIKRRKIVRAKIAGHVGMTNSNFYYLERKGYGITEERLAGVLDYLGMSLQELIGHPTVKALCKKIASDFTAYENQIFLEHYMFTSANRRNKKDRTISGNEE